MLKEIILAGAMLAPETCSDKPIWESWAKDFGQQYAFEVKIGNVPVPVWIDPVEGDWTLFGDTGVQYCFIIAGTEWPEGRR